MRRYHLPWVIVCSALPLLTVACGGAGADGSGGPRTVTGTSLVTYLPLDAATGVITPDPIPNPFMPSVQAVLPDGTAFHGTFNSVDGSFSIPNVPAGHYYLILGNETVIWTDRSAVDLGWSRAGRKDAQLATAGTELRFNTAGLNPWNLEGNHDYVEYFDYNTDAYADSFGASNLPTNRSTALNGMTIPWQNNLADTTQGDAPIIAQMVTTRVGSEHVQIAQKAYSPSPLIMGDGTGATINGAFADLSPGASLAFNWNRSEFAAYRSDLPLQVEHASPHFYVSATPGLTQNGYVGTALDLLEYHHDSSDVTTDVDLGPLTLPALPPHFEGVVSAGQSFQIYLTLPGTTVPWWYRGRVSQVVTMDFPTDVSPLKPIVSPPRNLRIGATSLFGDVSGVGLNPTLAWDPPTLGSPQGYRIYVYEIFANGSATLGNYLCKVYTKETHMKIPSNFLEIGKHYFFIVRAMARSGYDPTAAPWGFERPPYGYADNVSGLITP
jgi:hypothetical protein